MTTEVFQGDDPGRFTGAKLALLTGDKVISILRDDRPDIEYPAFWDLPGGGREGDETPVDCVLRETHEELGLRLEEEALIWRRAFVSTNDPTAAGWFFAAHITPDQVGRIRLGNEGQRWRQMGVAQFLRLSDAVPYLQGRLRFYLDDIEQGG
ncbi:NUDIX domain-containing protein [Oceaniglobus trochenteri]|uniref:NUDIX domain-containing protein n=1 Tax=Oceaniglobus trochenteri TaxID=2763260 RepID=UPI001D001660|nr:NUDIX hydrolase [Oceaniglobus trochenteri]